MSVYNVYDQWECVCVLFSLVTYVHTYIRAYTHTHTHTHTHTELKIKFLLGCDWIVWNVYWLFIVSLKHIKRLHGVTSQKMVIFLATTMRTSDLTTYRTICRILLITRKSLMLWTECILMTSHIMVHADNVIFLSFCKDYDNWFTVHFQKDSAYILTSQRVNSEM